MSDMSDWEREIADANQLGDFIQPLDINEYFEWYSDEVEAAWDLAPTGDMSEGQLDHFIDMLESMAEELDMEEWADMMEWMGEDFWEWYHENYM